MLKSGEIRRLKNKHMYAVGTPDEKIVMLLKGTQPMKLDNSKGEPVILPVERHFIRQQKARHVNNKSTPDKPA